MGANPAQIAVNFHDAKVDPTCDDLAHGREAIAAIHVAAVSVHGDRRARCAGDAGEKDRP